MDSTSIFQALHRDPLWSVFVSSSGLQAGKPNKELPHRRLLPAKEDAGKRSIDPPGTSPESRLFDKFRNLSLFMALKVAGMGPSILLQYSEMLLISSFG